MAIKTQFVSLSQVMRAGFLGKDGRPTREFILLLQSYDDKLQNTFDLIGQIAATAKIAGRTEGIGTTVQNLDAGGIVLAPGADFARAYANKDTDHITDATGNPLAGGKRGYQALDANNRLAGTFHGNPVNSSNVPQSASTLSNDGVSTSITVAAATDSFGGGSVSDNGGSVDPGAFGTYYVYHDDPTFAGGAVVYQASAMSPAQSQADGRIVDGKITTVAGAAKTGGGNTGGTTVGGTGGRGYTV